TIWARGRDWKASFDAAGMAFIPFLGSQAPRDFPVKLTLHGARIGTSDLALVASAAIRDGDRITIERGALREVFDLSPGSVEQSFVLDTLPSSGGLRLAIGLETELQASCTGAGIELANELGGVRVSGVTVL